MRILDKILAVGEDGSPVIFNYAPLPENSVSERQGTNAASLNFVKYVSSKDLNENGEYVKKLGLEKDVQYVIKYSHGGRTLGDASLKLRITAPENQNMILDLVGMGKRETPEVQHIIIDEGNVSDDDEPEDKTESEDVKISADVFEDKNLYVDTKLEVIPDEAPCIMLYSFKAPLKGEYEFAVRETNMFSVTSPDSDEAKYHAIPFEFRIYSEEDNYSAVDDEEKKLEARKILHLQRILLDNATEFNENGLPVTFDGSSEENSTKHRDLAYDVLDGVFGGPGYKTKIEPDPVLNDVPYDHVYEFCSGFYSHSGMRAIGWEAVYDDDYSPYAIQKMTEPDSQNNFEESLNIKLIETEEEHNSFMGLDLLDNFALIREALGYDKRQDGVNLGMNNVKTISVNYEIKEKSPRMPDIKDFEMDDEALRILKEEGFERFQREFGDYFVAGYTYGARLRCTIQVRANDEKTCNYVCNLVMNFLNGKADKWSVLPPIKITSFSCTGSGSVPTNLGDIEELLSTVRELDRSKYEKLYVTLVRYRELEEARPYIHEDLPIGGDLFLRIRDLNKLIYVTRCYYNAIASIPASELINGSSTSDGWKNEFDDLVNDYKNRLNYLCADINRINDYYNKFDSLLNKYKAICNRYAFYRYFVAQQIATTTGSWSGNHFSSISKGFDANDVAKNDTLISDFSEENTRFQRDGSGSTDDDEVFMAGNYGGDYRIYKYEAGPLETGVSANATNYNTNHRVIGTHTIYWKVSIKKKKEVEEKAWKVYMPEDKYPFVGLDDGIAGF